MRFIREYIIIHIIHLSAYSASLYQQSCVVWFQRTELFFFLFLFLPFICCGSFFVASFSYPSLKSQSGGPFSSFLPLLLTFSPFYSYPPFFLSCALIISHSIFLDFCKGKDLCCIFLESLLNLFDLAPCPIALFPMVHTHLSRTTFTSTGTTLKFRYLHKGRERTALRCTAYRT